MELATEDVIAEFGGKEVGWDIMNVKQEKILLPPEVNVPVKVFEVKIISDNKDGSQRQWKMFVPRFQLLSHLEVNGEQKFKGSIVDGRTSCYYADESKYDYKKPFFAKQQFLVELASLCRATNVGVRIGKNGATDEDFVNFVSEVVGKKLLITIKQEKVEALNAETGLYEPTEELKNVAINFKKMPEEMMV